MHRTSYLICLCLAYGMSGAALVLAEGEPCRIVVVDKENDWPVPLIQLRTVNHLLFVTDNAGTIAINEPDLLHREVFFHVEGHGYEVRADGFGYRGIRVTPEPGKTIRIEVSRTILAKRLGRLTGSGIFAHSPVNETSQPSRESGVVGCDSVLTALHRGKLYWLWGDTSLPHYPLGVFHSTSATTATSPWSWEPPIYPDFDYFRDHEGRPRGVAKMPGTGPTWLTGYVSLPDKQGTPHLVATYHKIKPPLETYELGLCVWNEDREEFERHRVLWEKNADNTQPPPSPQGHPVFWKDGKDKEWLLFGNPLPKLRCPATFEAWQDPDTWETLDPPVALMSLDGQREVTLHSGSIAYSPWNQRWVTVFMEKFGKPSAFGELWYAEAKSPEGPWGRAVKILSHNNYTFYNPRIHAEALTADSPVLLFEGTYTHQFTNNLLPTPRYDYNQILYRLDLNDPRLQQDNIQP